MNKVHFQETISGTKNTQNILAFLTPGYLGRLDSLTKTQNQKVPNNGCRCYT